MTNKKNKKKKAKKKAAKKRQPPLTNAMVKAWGFECDDIVAAAVKYKGNLIDRLKRSKALRDAWDRGRFLRDISQFAYAGATKAQVATKLRIDLPAFEEMLSAPEASDIWITAQNNGEIEVLMGVKAEATAGNKAALKSLGRIYQNERPAGSVLDLYRMTIDQMCYITGITRQTLHAWVTEYKLPRNGDKTFDLRVFIKWFEIFTQRKVNVTPQVTGEDSLRELKAVQLKNKIEEDVGKLLPRDEVIKGLVARLRQFLTLWDRLVDGVCDKCANLPKQGVDVILALFKDELRGEFCKVEFEMKLNESQVAELETFLKRLE